MAKSKLPSLDHLNTWISEKRYPKVIDAVEAIPAEMRNPELNLRLGLSYMCTADFGTLEGRQQLQKAAELLEPIQPVADDLQDPFLWYYTMGCILSFQERLLEAQPYIQKAYGLDSNRADVADMVELCRRAADRPKARWTFREGVQKAWDAFTQRQPEILQQLAKEQTGRCSDKLERMVARSMTNAFSEPKLSVWKTAGKPWIVFDATVSNIGILQIQALLRQAPAAVREVWDFQIGPLPDKRSREVRIYLRKYGEMPVQLYEDASGEIVSAKLMEIPIVLTGAQYQVYSMMFPDFQEAFRYIRKVLGALPFWRLAHVITREMHPGQTVPLRDLVQTLAEHGLDCSETSASKVLPPLPYERSKRARVKAWRGMQESGEHRYPELLDTIDDRYLYFSNDTVQDGVEGGYLVWPIQNGTSRKGQAQTVQFQKELQTRLLEEAGEDCLTPLGRGADPYFAYLDFVAWDLQPVLEAAADLLQDAGLPWAVYRPYRDTDPPTSLFGFPARPLQRR